MEASRGNSPTTRLLSSWMGLSSQSRYQVLFGVGSALAFAHTVDEMRIGQFVAVPFALANAFVLGAWPRLPNGWRAALAIAFGLLWIVTAVPYHILPLLHGVVIWQNVSGLSRIFGGVILIANAIGIAIGGRASLR
jgi:hypothetical protein